MRKTLAAMAALVSLAAGLLVAETSRGLEMQLKAAQHKAQVEGDIEGAIEDFRKLAENGDRTIRAKAILGMARCYETLGKAEANKLYERVAREFPDQSDLAAEAIKRLGVMDRSSFDGGLSVRRIWPDAPGLMTGAPARDESYLTFTDADTGDLSVRNLSTGATRRITANKSADDGNAEDSIPSPDGKQIAYAWFQNGHGDLRVIHLDGSGMRVLYSDPAVRYVELYDWSPDEKNILVVLQKENHQRNEMALIGVADRSVRVLKTMGLPHPDRIRFSPDGRSIVFDTPQAKDAKERDIFVMSAAGSGETAVVRHPADDYVLGWADQQRVLFGSDRLGGAMSAWSIRVTDGKPQGTPELIRKDLGPARPMGPSMTKRGALYYSIKTGTQEVYTAELNPATGKVVIQPTPAAQRFVGGNSRPLWSPDGKRLAYLSYRGEDSDAVITILELSSAEERFLSPHLPNMFLNSWLPDGQKLAATSRPTAVERKLHTINANTGVVTALTGQLPGKPDAKWKFRVNQKTLFVRDLQSNEEKMLYSLTGDECFCAIQPSPDGTQIAILTNKKIISIPVPGGDPRTLATINSNDPQELAWTAGGYVLFLKKAKDSNELWRVSSAGGAPQKLDIAMPGLTELSVHPDGHRIAFRAGVPKSDVWVMENFLGKAN
jgi:Tol biopolymer transport system component